MNKSFLKVILPATLGIASILTLQSCFLGIPKGATAVKDFDSEKYLGKWFEIARLDHSFERNIDHATANYSLNSKGNIKVVNKGFDTKNKKWKESVGEAKFIGNSNEARLKVSFFKPIWGSYNVVDIIDYKYALIAGNSTKYLWILSREETIPEEVKSRFLKKSRELNFPVENLIWVTHNKK